eukprot:scaffold1044_cov332-Prasinococcus_capsulatus_cf.AAC.1
MIATMRMRRRRRRKVRALLPSRIGAAAAGVAARSRRAATAAVGRRSGQGAPGVRHRLSRGSRRSNRAHAVAPFALLRGLHGANSTLRARDCGDLAQVPLPRALRPAQARARRRNGCAGSSA